MSLIQDALKRQMEESDVPGAAGNTGAAGDPPSPTSGLPPLVSGAGAVPSGPPPLPPEKKPRTVMVLVGIGLLCLVVVLAVGALGYFAYSSFAGGKAASASAKKPAAAAKPSALNTMAQLAKAAHTLTQDGATGQTSAAAMAKLIGLGDSNNAALKSLMSNAVALAQTSAVPVAGTSTGQPEVATSVPAAKLPETKAPSKLAKDESLPATETVPETAATKPGKLTVISKAKVSGKTALATVAWPRLKLSGILSSIGSKEGAALINGKMVYPGSIIEQVTVVQVKADGVHLKFGQETRFLKVGQSTQ